MIDRTLLGGSRIHRARHELRCLHVQLPRRKLSAGAGTSAGVGSGLTGARTSRSWPPCRPLAATRSGGAAEVAQAALRLLQPAGRLLATRGGVRAHAQRGGARGRGAALKGGLVHNELHGFMYVTARPGRPFKGRVGCC